MQSDKMESTNEELYDADLPSTHSYLGDNLAPVRGRVIHQDNAFVSLPLLPKPYLYGTLLPGQTFPISAHNSTQNIMIDYCLKHEHTFGCLAKTSNTNYSTRADLDGEYGTTVEIIEYYQRGGSFMCKGKARQRFRVISSKTTSHGFAVVMVKILPEINLYDSLCTKDYNSLNRLPRSQKEKAKHWMAQTTPWPKWVYDQYNVSKLVEQIKAGVTYATEEMFDSPSRIPHNGNWLVNKNIVLPTDPTTLTYFLANHLNTDERLELLKLNNPIERIRWLLQSIKKPVEYKCSHCFKRVTTKENSFAMSVEGMQGTYVNPSGIYHDTITFYNVENCNVSPGASTEYSWFPGYAWSIATCAECDSHLGWLFTANNRNLRPKKFYGLTRLSVTTRDPDPEHDYFPYNEADRFGLGVVFFNNAAMLDSDDD